MSLRLETLTLRTSLSAEECRQRLTQLARRGAKSRLGIRGIVVRNWFAFGRSVGEQIPPRTWVRGSLYPEPRATRVEITVGPNPLLGPLVLSCFAMLAAGAILITVLRFGTPAPHLARLVWFSWTVVATFGGLFLLGPTFEVRKERAFLVAALERLLEAGGSSAPTP